MSRLKSLTRHATCRRATFIWVLFSFIIQWKIYWMDKITVKYQSINANNGKCAQRKTHCNTPPKVLFALNYFWVYSFFYTQTDYTIDGVVFDAWAFSERLTVSKHFFLVYSVIKRHRMGENREREKKHCPSICRKVDNVDYSSRIRLRWYFGFFYCLSVSHRITTIEISTVYPYTRQNRQNYDKQAQK